MKNSIGVIVARFQIPSLHAGHRYLLDYVSRRHKKIFIVLGIARSLPTDTDPLDFETRSLMIKKAYPEIKVGSITDCGSDEVWSQRLDQLIASEFPNKTVVLYGSRKSFLPYYSGKNKTVFIKELPSSTGTEIRNQTSRVTNSRDFRKGIIYGQIKRNPHSYQAVDIAVMNGANEVLLAGKERDGDKLRFIGGFVDVEDNSLEHAAHREVMEEANMIEIANIKYIGSIRIDDWRYRKTKDKIMSAFFIATYVFGRPEPKDDIDVIRWVPLSQAKNKIVPEHEPLLEMLQKEITKKGEKNGNLG